MAFSGLAQSNSLEYPYFSMEILLCHGSEPLVPQMIPVQIIESKSAPPPKEKKTSQWKRHHRSLSSPWHTNGSKKQARTLQWRPNQKLRLFKQVLYDNQINLKELHGALLWYFRQEVKFDEEENSRVPPIAEQVVSGCSRQSFVVIEEKSCTADPLDYQRPPMSEPSARPAEEFEEVEIEELPRRPPTQVPVADEFEEVEI